MAFTEQRVEDAIFVKEKYIISLEYIFYQTHGNYVEIEEIPNAYENKRFYPLGTEKYKQSSRDFVRAFEDKPKNFRASQTSGDYIKNHKGEMIESEYEYVSAIEPLICKYAITKTGQIERIN